PVLGPGIFKLLRQLLERKLRTAGRRSGAKAKGEEDWTQSRHRIALFRKAPREVRSDAASKFLRRFVTRVSGQSAAGRVVAAIASILKTPATVRCVKARIAGLSTLLSLCLDGV